MCKVLTFRNPEVEAREAYAKECAATDALRVTEKARIEAGIAALPEARRLELDALVDQINRSEPTADHLIELYGDCLMDPGDLNDILKNTYHPEFLEFVDKARAAGWSDDDIRAKLIDAAYISAGDMWNETSEINCIDVGEYEDQLDIGLALLNDIERVYVQQRANAYVPDRPTECVYWSTGVWLRLVVDVDQLPKRIRKRRGAV